MVLWFVMFVLKPFNFWISMAFSTSLLSVISYVNFKDQFKKEYFNLKEISIGVGSAVLLYFIFFAGRYVLDTFGIIPNHSQNISSVYANKEIFPGWVVAMLLFFPIGFGEEFFWRGYLQRYLSAKHGKWVGFGLTVLFYTLGARTDYESDSDARFFCCRCLLGADIFVERKYCCRDNFAYALGPVYFRGVSFELKNA